VSLQARKYDKWDCGISLVELKKRLCQCETFALATGTDVPVSVRDGDMQSVSIA